MEAIFSYVGNGIRRKANGIFSDLTGYNLPGLNYSSKMLPDVDAEVEYVPGHKIGDATAVNEGNRIMVNSDYANNPAKYGIFEHEKAERDFGINRTNHNTENHRAVETLAQQRTLQKYGLGALLEYGKHLLRGSQSANESDGAKSFYTFAYENLRNLVANVTGSNITANYAYAMAA